ncbi:GST N-terminal domain-containing protein [Mycena kentingensis (nom. inval.)]|nr:GST N-terminal domain-containing protein [Mycena kentingensis (nom. inval.)]
MKPIVFYDIPYKVKGGTWSPNTWKVRYALNFKSLPYQTTWVEYPDIEALYTETLKIPPCQILRSGKPYYCLPVIYDPNTDTTISDSLRIADYLDKTYPTSGAGLLFPGGAPTRALQAGFIAAYDSVSGPMAQFIIPCIASILNARSEEYFTRTRTESFGKPLKDVFPAGEERTQMWEKTKAAFAKIDEWIAHSDADGPFVMGAKPSFADFVIAGEMQWCKIGFGPESEMWREWAGWHNGRWLAFIDNVKQHEGEDQV